MCVLWQLSGIGLRVCHVASLTCAVLAV